jgi:hypothetical protein
MRILSIHSCGTARVLLHDVKSYETFPLYFPSERKLCCWFIALKNPSPCPGSNPQPLSPVASTLTTTPPRRPHSVYKTVSKNVAAHLSPIRPTIELYPTWCMSGVHPALETGNLNTNRPNLNYGLTTYKGQNPGESCGNRRGSKQ